MYLTSTLKRTLVIAGTSLLAVVGMVGWTREAARTDVKANSYSAAPNSYPVSPNWNVPQDASALRDPNAPVVYAPSPFGSETPAARTVPEYQAYAAPAAAAAYAPARTRVAPQRRYYRSADGRRHYVVVRKRPFKRSAAIVGGSAAGGALIGALAGGGKGAAIGALAGGGGGLIYDRLTAKKKEIR